MPPRAHRTLLASLGVWVGLASAFAFAPPSDDDESWSIAVAIVRPTRGQLRSGVRAHGHPVGHRAVATDEVWKDAR